jgi:hypothetical protein
MQNWISQINITTGLVAGNLCYESSLVAVLCNSLLLNEKRAIFPDREKKINISSWKLLCFLNSPFALFLMQYIHIIRGEELYRLARDYTRYMVTGKRTARLKRAMLNWRDFSESITKKDVGAQEDYYGRSTSSESTWWQQP